MWLKCLKIRKKSLAFIFIGLCTSLFFYLCLLQLADFFIARRYLQRWVNDFWLKLSNWHDYVSHITVVIPNEKDTKVIEILTLLSLIILEVEIYSVTFRMVSRILPFHSLWIAWKTNLRTDGIRYEFFGVWIFRSNFFGFVTTEFSFFFCDFYTKIG